MNEQEYQFPVESYSPGQPESEEERAAYARMALAPEREESDTEKAVSRLWETTVFPAPCVWCDEAGEPYIIESKEECGGFDLNTERPICDECASAAEEDLRSGEHWY